MAIDAYTGLPRSGKSYSVVEHVILPALRDGRHVVTNIPLRLDALSEDGFDVDLVRVVTNEEVATDGFFNALPPGIALVLDELWRLWPAGLKANNASEEHKSYLAEHGHKVDEQGRTTTIALVTQDLAQVAAWVRLLVAFTYRTTKLDMVGRDNSFRVDVYQGCVTGQNPPKSQMVREMFGTYKPEVYRYYKSAMYSQTGDVGNEKRMDKRANALRSPALIAMLAAAPLLLLGGGFGVYRFFTQGGEGLVGNPEPPRMVASMPRVQGEPVFAQPVSVPVQPVQRGPMWSRTWRLAGVVVKPSGEGLAVLQSVHGQRTIPTAHCWQVQDSPDWVCEFDGELVAAWSGFRGETMLASPISAASDALAPSADRASGATTTAKGG